MVAKNMTIVIMIEPATRMVDELLKKNIKIGHDLTERTQLEMGTKVIVRDRESDSGEEEEWHRTSVTPQGVQLCSLKATTHYPLPPPPNLSLLYALHDKPQVCHTRVKD